MAVTYSTAVKNARLDVVTAQSGATAVLEIGTSAGMTTILATIGLASPIAAAAAGGILTLTMPRSDASADATGVAAFARIRTATGGTDIITGLTVGLVGSNINLDNTSILTGQNVTISSATITHG